MNPRAYPRGPRYRVNAPTRPVRRKRSRRSWYAIAGAAAGLVALAAALAVVLLPTFDSSTQPEDAAGSGMAATRPRDFAPTPLVLSPTPQPSPIPTPTPRPVPTADPSLTIDEIASIIKFANSLMFLEMRQRNIVRDYRIYNIEFLTRWIGESYSGAEALLESQRRLLADVHKVEAPDIEGAAVSLSLYVDSMEEGVEAFERLLAALGPLNEAGVSVVGGIRMGMLPNIGINEGLSRSAMTRRDARERLEALVNRAGLVLGDVESTRRGASDDL